MVDTESQRRLAGLEMVIKLVQSFDSGQNHPLAVTIIVYGRAGLSGQIVAMCCSIYHYGTSDQFLANSYIQLMVCR